MFRIQKEEGKNVSNKKKAKKDSEKNSLLKVNEEASNKSDTNKEVDSIPKGYVSDMVEPKKLNNIKSYFFALFSCVLCGFLVGLLTIGYVHYKSKIQNNSNSLDPMIQNSLNSIETSQNKMSDNIDDLNKTIKDLTRKIDVMESKLLDARSKEQQKNIKRKK